MQGEQSIMSYTDSKLNLTNELDTVLIELRDRVTSTQLIIADINHETN